MKRLLTPLLLLLLMVLVTPLWAAQTVIQGVRVWTDPEKTRLVFETSGPVVHRIFALDGPDRVILDIDDVRMAGSWPTVEPDDANVVGLRGGVRDGSGMRIVVDLKKAVRAKSYGLSPNERYGHRLVIDLLPRDGSSVRQVALPSLPYFGSAPSRRANDGQRDGLEGKVIVAIDAGHGGEDPGAIGAAGTKEKDVTLAVAQELARLIDRQPGLAALMIRDGDYYVGLRERIELARKQRADLFISIHADAFTNTTTRGSSVYTLSHGVASSSAAKWLASHENSVDQVGGEDQPVADDLLTSVLMDMTQNATIELSTKLAGLVIAKLGRQTLVHNNEVQRAGFAVLRASDIPSILVETAFISNPEDEQRLRDPAHQRALARAIYEGVEAYFRLYPPPGLRMASAAGETGRKPASAGARVPSGGGREYVINPGDTLSGIAKRHQVSLSALRSHNGLTNDMIRVGQVLTIPEDS